MCKTAIQKAVRFLVERQSLDGAWRDFSLEPGESDSWTTAYVAGCLSQVPSVPAPLGREEALNRAGQWLRGAMREDGGWGYNGNCPVDSDSTAHAVLFLSPCEAALPDRCYDRLLRFQRADGGFATFERIDPDNSWGVSHPDVSPIVLRALLTRLSPDDAAIRRGLAYSLSTLGPEALWPSYWWVSPLYATLANIRLLTETRTSYDQSQVVQGLRNVPLPSNVFELALLGEIWAVLDPGNPNTVEADRKLTELQWPDGSWQTSTPILRVPDPHCRTLWTEDDSGVVVSDSNHLFTTATALRCLAALSGTT